VTHFVKLFSRRMGKRVESVSPATMAAFQWYSWPGNIRELQNLVERAVILSQGSVLPNPLPKKGPFILSGNRPPQVCQSWKALEDSDRALIVETLEQAGWVVGGPRGAAAKLGLKRTTLLAKMRRLGISRPIDQDGRDGNGIAPETIRREYAQF
jgi:DNA-binding NtrC family response regulator